MGKKLDREEMLDQLIKTAHGRYEELMEQQEEYKKDEFEEEIEFPDDYYVDMKREDIIKEIREEIKTYLEIQEM